LKNFNLNVIVVPSRPERRTISLEEVFKTAYVVSNHLPNRDDNKNVITKEMFESMRHGATFINTGRGAQVDEAGMIEVLKKRPDLTALLDVLVQEPPAEDSELYKLPNVRLSSHIAGSLNDEFHRMADYAIDDFVRFANGEELLNEVTESILITS
jgi:phosphoglycerate dehydrogenase-like enzyme